MDHTLQIHVMNSLVTYSKHHGPEHTLSNKLIFEIYRKDYFPIKDA